MRTLIAVTGAIVAPLAMADPVVPNGYSVEVFATGTGAATALAIGPDGRVYITDYQGGRLLRQGQGEALEAVTSGIPYLVGVAFGPSGRLFVVGNDCCVYEIVSGVAQQFASGMSYPTSVAFNGTDLYVSSLGQISAVSVADGAVTTLLAVSGSPFGLAFDGAGRLYYSVHESGVLYRYDFLNSPVAITSLTPYGSTYTGFGFGGRLMFSDYRAARVVWERAPGLFEEFASGFTGGASPPVIGPTGIFGTSDDVVFVADGSQVWRIRYTGASSPPIAPSIAPRTAVEGQTTSFSVPEFSDPDGETLTYAFSGLPPWLSVYNPATNPRFLLGTPPYTESGPSTEKTYWITVTATDPANLTASRSFSLSVINANGPPQRPNSIPGPTAYEGNYLSYSVPVFPDPDGDPVSYSYAGLPSWLAVYNPASNPRFLYGRPPFTESGPNNNRVYWVTVTATDNFGHASSRAFPVTVQNVNTAPTAPVIPAQVAVEGQWFQFTVPRFSDADGDTLSYSFVGLPTWLTQYNPAANPRYLLGRPPFSETSPGTPAEYTVEVTATDSSGASASRQIQISVLDAG